MSTTIPAGDIVKVGVPPSADLPVRIEWQNANGDWQVYGVIEHRGDTLTVAGPAVIRGVSASTKCGEGAVCPHVAVEVDMAACSICTGGAGGGTPPLTPKCISFHGFDFFDRGEWNNESVSTFTIYEDDQVAATVTIDYLAAGGTQKSAWYQQVVDAVNAVGGGNRWNMSVMTDVPQDQEGRVQWLLKYTDSGTHTLQIEYDTGYQAHIFTGSGDNDIVASVMDGATPQADFGTPGFQLQDC